MATKTCYTILRLRFWIKLHFIQRSNTVYNPWFNVTCRKRLIRRSSEGPSTGLTNAGAHSSSGRRFNERPSSCGGERGAKAHCLKSSKTSAASVASSWENVDESDVNSGMWSAPIDSLATMNCQRWVKWSLLSLIKLTECTGWHIR